MAGCDLQTLSSASVACFCCPLFIEPCGRLCGHHSRRQSHRSRRFWLTNRCLTRSCLDPCRIIVIPKISRALFAVAMTAQSSAWRNEDWNLPLSLTSRKKLSSREEAWDVLDFRETDHSLRWNLSDDDLGALLAVIDGRNKLKKLFLTD